MNAPPVFRSMPRTVHGRPPVLRSGTIIIGRTNSDKSTPHFFRVISYSIPIVMSYVCITSERVCLGVSFRCRLRTPETANWDQGSSGPDLHRLALGKKVHLVREI